MGIKDNNIYRLTHRQRGQTIPDLGVRLHNGLRGIDVADLFGETTDRALEGAAKTGLGAFIACLKSSAPNVYAAAVEANAFEDIRISFLDPRR